MLAKVCHSPVAVIADATSAECFYLLLRDTRGCFDHSAGAVRRGEPILAASITPNCTGMCGHIVSNRCGLHPLAVCVNKLLTVQSTYASNIGSCLRAVYHKRARGRIARSSCAASLLGVAMLCKRLSGLIQVMEYMAGLLVLRVIWLRGLRTHLPAFPR